MAWKRETIGRRVIFSTRGVFGEDVSIHCPEGLPGPAYLTIYDELGRLRVKKKFPNYRSAMKTANLWMSERWRKIMAPSRREDLPEHIRRQIPASATFWGRWEWPGGKETPPTQTPPGGRYALWFEVYEGYKSMGYKSGYQPVLMRWVVVRFSKPRGYKTVMEVWQFSGRNLKHAEKLIRDAERIGYRKVE